MLQIRPLVLTRDVSTSCCKQKDDFQDLIHPESREPGIPRYVEREGENTNLKRARYQSNFCYNEQIILSIAQNNTSFEIQCCACILCNEIYSIHYYFRLIYQSRKRGMLENGLLLSTFATKYLNTFDDKQLRLYDRLINLPSNDWDIFYWMTGVKPTPPEFDNEVMDLLKKHIQNEDRQARIMQPDL